MILTDALSRWRDPWQSPDAAEAEVRETCDNHHDIASDLGLTDSVRIRLRVEKLGEASSTRWRRPCLSHWFSRQGSRQVSMGKRPTRAERGVFFFGIFVRSTALQHLGCEARRTQGLRENATSYDNLRQRWQRKCKKFLRSCKNLHKAPGALCWVHPLRFWLQIFGLPPFGGWMKVRYGKLWQVMVRLG